MNKVKFECELIGPGLCDHNYLCAVCQEGAAVYYLNESVLLPCWDCQKDGYQLIKSNKVVLWMLQKIGVTVL